MPASAPPPAQQVAEPVPAPNPSSVQTLAQQLAAAAAPPAPGAGPASSETEKKEPTPTKPTNTGATAAAPSPSVINKPLEAGEDDEQAPPRKWNEYDGPLTTFRFGFGYLLDFATYAQDETSKKQVTMNPGTAVRDSRILFRGRAKTDFPLSWTLGYMYDGTNDKWFFRQTGIDVGFPKLYGHLFLGRTKEGYSLVKVMTGYHPWTEERQPVLDAFVPILADGAKWMGYFPKPRVFYSLGLFSDQIFPHADEEKFATYDHQVVSRVTWLPILSEPDKKLLHVGAMIRDGKPDQNSLQVRSRPEDNLAPYFLDTGKFAADHARTMGLEAYYRKGSWLFGSEYDWQQVDTPDGRHPLFHGGDVVATWLITGETRAYNEQGAYFMPVSPKRSVFQGGPGAVEAVLHLSYADFDSGGFKGGKLVRLTPMVNWHLSDNFRLEFIYGFSVLDRFDLKGDTHFFQFRIQTTL